MNGTVLAADLGGTWLKLGLVRGGRVVAKRVIESHSARGLAPRLPAIERTFTDLCAQAGVPLVQCQGVVLGFPGLVDTPRGRVTAVYGKFDDALHLDLAGWAQQRLGLPLALENDARLAAVGEWRHGAGRSCDNLVMLTLGTGLGTAAIVQGRVLRGCHGQAGCLGGHFTVRYGGRRCAGGNIGCAEAEASTAHLTALAQADPDFARSALKRLGQVDYAAVFEHAAAGDAAALRLRAHSLTVWSALVVTLIHAYDPERVVLGGGIMASGDAILAHVQAYVAEHAETPWGRVQIVAGALGQDAALLGSPWLLAEQRAALASAVSTSTPPSRETAHDEQL